MLFEPSQVFTIADGDQMQIQQGGLQTCQDIQLQVDAFLGDEPASGHQHKGDSGSCRILRAPCLLRPGVAGEEIEVVVKGESPEDAMHRVGLLCIVSDGFFGEGGGADAVGEHSIA